MRTLIVMAKAPRSGAVKTRLARAPLVGLDGAARLAEAFLRDTVDHCEALCDSAEARSAPPGAGERMRGARRSIDLVISYSPRDTEEHFRGVAPRATLEPQVDGDLGLRVRGAFDAAFARGATHVIVIGSDTPHLSVKALARAFDELDDAAGVIGPSTDGGYYLLGLRAPAPYLFDDIEWSTERVFAQTMRAARERGLRLRELDAMFDVDEPRDLERLRSLLAIEGESACPHTALVLRELDRS